jgi:enoyl-[acyl-carrier-protein] reductase (NADH)
VQDPRTPSAAFGTLLALGSRSSTEARATLDGSPADINEHRDGFSVHIPASTGQSRRGYRGRAIMIPMRDCLCMMNISAYSLVAVAERACEMVPHGSVRQRLRIDPHAQLIRRGKMLRRTTMSWASQGRGREERAYCANAFGPTRVRVNAISGGLHDWRRARSVTFASSISRTNSIHRSAAGPHPRHGRIAPSAHGPASRVEPTAKMHHVDARTVGAR